MNRRDVYPDIVGVRVPRTRGDEPSTAHADKILRQRSPHTRG